ncbi:MAG: hypothetical protein Q4A01_08890 [Coriobacteriales bacterium]|nr:hypothetical protein [Coriobacteriales bacterium]
MEKRLIEVLSTQDITHLPITSEEQLLANIRQCMNELNGITLSDREWKAFLHEYLARGTDGFAQKAEKFQRNPRYSLRRDDGTTKNLDIVDKTMIGPSCRSKPQAGISEREEAPHKHPRRYQPILVKICRYLQGIKTSMNTRCRCWKAESLAS